MKHKFLLTTALATIMSAATASAQTYTVLVDFDKKVIKADSLGLPKSSKAESILRILPELLERPGYNYVNNYDVQIEGMSVGDNVDVVLHQLQLFDIDKIEVSEDPISSYKNNGQGGSINFVLKKKDRGTWGNASVDGITPTNITPNFMVNHNTGKFLVRGILMGELYDNSSTTTISGADATTDLNFKTQLARVYTVYNPTDKDELKLNLSESYSYSKTSYSTSEERDKEKLTTLKALLKYKHTFNNQSNLQAEVQYNYLPANDDYSSIPSKYYGVISEQIGIKSNSVGGKVEFKQNLLSPKDKNFVNVSVGVNGNYNVDNKDYDFYNCVLADKDALGFSTKGNTTHIMPFLNFESLVGQVKVKIVGEYQYYKYNVERNGGDESSVDRNDFTGKMMFEWQFRPNRNLRFILDRKLQRPTNEQIYAVQVFDPEQGMYVRGDINLEPALSHEFSIDYISNHAWDNHRLTFNASVSYNLIVDIIRSKIVGGSYDEHSGLGVTQQYVTYKNIGNNKQLNANIMALYSHRAFSLALAANLFHNNITDEDNDNVEESKQSYYYNLSLMPSLNLTNDWMGSVSLSYFSKVKNSGGELGDLLLSYLRIGKSFGAWNVSCFVSLALTGKTKDITNNSVKQNNLVHNTVGIGVMYHF